MVNVLNNFQRKQKIELIEAKRRRSTELKSKKSPNKVVNPNKTVAQMLQQKKTTKTNGSDNSNEIEEIEITSDSDEPIVSTSVRDVIDSVAKGEDRTNGEEIAKEKQIVTNISNGSSDIEDFTKKDGSTAVKLPDNLPQELTLLIERIKKVFIDHLLTTY